jgi:hypothetical protein
VDERVEYEAEWFGPIEFERVRSGDFTPSMSEGFAGLYFWGAKRRREFRGLYVGQSVDPAERQEDHLQGTLGRNLRRIREQGWDPLFWSCQLRCDTFCNPRASFGSISGALKTAEKVIMYAIKPEWNRADSGYIELSFPVRLVSRGRRPFDIPKVVRLKAGRHA